MAYLHDPPEKAYDYSQRHEQRAASHAGAFGCNALDLPTNEGDCSASAADRFIFPKAGVGRDFGGGVSFCHPFSGEKVAFKWPSQNDVEEAVSAVVPSFHEVGDHDRFWLAWRCWMHNIAVQDKVGAGFIPYLPADTRIPDGTIWLHNAVTSALEATRAGSQGSDRLQPAMFLFQLGPVQDFIAQSRSTRDLWSGSFLLSWMMMHAIIFVAEECGPDAIVFPSLRGLPLYDWVNRERLKKAKFKGRAAEFRSFWDVMGMGGFGMQDDVLTPNLPNRFLAVVPSGFDGKKVVAALENEWKNIHEACRVKLDSGMHPFGGKARKFWDFQVGHFWQSSWQLWPWVDAKAALAMVSALADGESSPVHKAYAAAMAIPSDERDTRCYKDDGDPSPGWAWGSQYQLLSHRLAARRQTRNFTAWQKADETERYPKDAFSGRAEIVADKAWLQKMRAADKEYAHLFRADEELGAVNLVKRVWHKAYLPSRGLQRARTSFDSVPAVAAAAWKVRVLDHMRTGKGSGTWSEFTDFRKDAYACNGCLDAVVPDPAEMPNEEEWLNKADASVFHESTWERMQGDPENASHRTMLAKAQGSLRALLKAAGSKPPMYYAVLSLDGDEIGKWLSGEKAPKVAALLTGKAREYFEKLPGGKEWMGSPRPVSPAYHLQFSEALSNFALYAVRRIVVVHCGQVIYAGGDDVLAMLPADEAIACARRLRMAFQGDVALADELPGCFSRTEPGFIKLSNPGAGEPFWPLLVPGPASSVSVGISVGHIREPLQDMVQAAHAAERRAKRSGERDGFGRDAFAVSLFKRSGEQVEWGAKFTAPVFELLDILQENYRQPLDEPGREMPISQKFPYRLAELLRVYGTDACLTEPVRDLALKEVAWAVRQMPMAKLSRDEKGRLQESLIKACADYLEILLKGVPVPGVVAKRSAPRPLSDFYNLFAVEAFIARQGE